jgi:alginate O-acetyltransferase complex protein AlgI
MLFNSIAFLVSFPAFVGIYFLSPKAWRWLILLLASYGFYAYWNVAFCSLIAISTLVDYGAGIKIHQAQGREKKAWLLLSLLTNLGILFTFKYLNFFASNVNYWFSEEVMPYHGWVLPLGISFYTFQTMSYSIDVYRGDRAPEKHLGYFATYVIFFPQLVAGPIERSTNLLPQLRGYFEFSGQRLGYGLALIIHGLFKKVVIADGVAPYVDVVFGPEISPSVMTIIMASYGFALQIYCDFSGYSDIAIGCAWIMGIKLMENFKRPYMAYSLAKFWSRWHISLSTWFKDYLYIPLGGNRNRVYRNLLIVFLVSGIWHGAEWTFAIWGLIHGVGLIAERVFILNNEPKGVRRWMRSLLIFHLVVFGWVFFRADNLTSAMSLLNFLFSGQGSFEPSLISIYGDGRLFLLGLAVFVLCIRSFYRELELTFFHQSILAFFDGAYKAFSLTLLVLLWSDAEQFIYFQF